jgi:hypothetical protein
VPVSFSQNGIVEVSFVEWLVQVKKLTSKKLASQVKFLKSWDGESSGRSKKLEKLTSTSSLASREAQKSSNYQQ